MKLENSVKERMNPQPQNENAEYVRDLTIVEVSRYIPELINYYQDLISAKP